MYYMLSDYDFKICLFVVIGNVIMIFMIFFFELYIFKLKMMSLMIIFLFLLIFLMFWMRFWIWKKLVDDIVVMMGGICGSFFGEGVLVNVFLYIWEFIFLI